MPGTAVSTTGVYVSSLNSSIGPTFCQVSPSSSNSGATANPMVGSRTTAPAAPPSAAAPAENTPRLVMVSPSKYPAGSGLGRCSGAPCLLFPSSAKVEKVLRNQAYRVGCVSQRGPHASALGRLGRRGAQQPGALGRSLAQRQLAPFVPGVRACADRDCRRQPQKRDSVGCLVATPGVQLRRETDQVGKLVDGGGVAARGQALQP